MANLFKTLFLAVVFAAVSASVLSAQDIDMNSALEKHNSYKLRPLDVLTIKVFQEPDLDSIYKIGADGTIVLPLINSVRVGGLTLQDAQQLIKQLYEKEYLVNASVAIFISEYAPQRVYVIGQVNTPGDVMFPPEEQMTLSKAIAGAKGTTRLANLRSIIVKRRLADGTTKVFDVDLKAIFNDKQAKDFPVYDGDTIEVPEAIF